MNKKILIGAGILLTVFIVFLIALCGRSGGDKIVTEEELSTTVSTVTCMVEDEENIDYEISKLTNDIQFDSKIKNKPYNKIIINKTKEVNLLGIAFLVKPIDDATFNINLTKNGETIKSTTVTVKAQEVGNVDLLLENAINFQGSDELAIEFSQTAETGFVFDTMLFFFDEV